MKFLLLSVLLVAGSVIARPKAESYAQGYAYGPYEGSYYVSPLIAATVASSQFHAQDEIGQYSYGYQNQNSAKSETKTADGVTRGSYSYIDANGVMQTTNYISDDIFGFRVAATNLPVSPAVPTADVPEEPVVVSNAPVMTPNVAYSYLPYATNYAYTMKSAPASVIAPAPVSTVVDPVVTVRAAPATIVAPVTSSAPLVAAPAIPAPVVAPAFEVKAVEEAPVAVPAVPVTQEVVTPVVSAPIKTQFHVQDEFGQYHFGYSEPSSDRVEAKRADGTVTGTYNYVDSDGKIQTVQYIADHLGFRVASTNLPVANHPVAPVPVAELPEVVAARLEHLKAVEETKLKIAKAVPVPEAAEPVLAPVVAEAVPVATPVAPAVEVKIDEVAQPVAQQILTPVVQQVATPVVQQVATPIVHGVTYANPSYPSAVQHHAQDEYGLYNYGYSNADSQKMEQRLADGTVRGTYSYVDANGLVQRVDYISDALGFRVAATNLPIAHGPEVAAPVAPAPVEVKAAPAPVAQVSVAQLVPVAESVPVAQTVPVAQAVPATQVTLNAVPVAQILTATAPVEAAPAQVAAIQAPVTTVTAPYAASYGYQPVTSPITASQYHAQSEIGEYSYGYSNPNSAKSEIKTADGITRGSYSYVDANGVVQTANYISDDVFGFRVAATNLPVAPAA